MPKTNDYYLDIALLGKYQLTEKQYTRLIEISDNLKTLLNEIDQYTLLRLNIEDFMKYMKLFEMYIDHDFVNLNRYFTNYINSFYMWISFHERYYKTVFSELKRSFYDDNFSYRAAYNIRIYTAHETMPVSSIFTDVINETISARIDISLLINTSCKIQSKFITELKEHYEEIKHIDILQLSKELKVVLEKFQRTIWDKLQPQVSAWLSYINNIFPIDDSNIVNAYVKSSNAEHSIPLGHQLKYLHEKALRERYDFLKV